MFLSVENISLKKQALLLEEVQKLNRENAAKSGHQLSSLDLEAGVPPKDQRMEVPTRSLVDYLHEDTQNAEAEKQEVKEAVSEEQIKDEKPEEKSAVSDKKSEPAEEREVGKKEGEEKLEVPEETQAETIIAAGELAQVPEVSDSHRDEKEVITTRYNCV